MGNETFDARGFSGIVPLFPLPNVVLFPGMFLPLHIFEPRYREMTADALQGERLISMALLKPGWQDDDEGSPPIHEVLGMGKIIEHAKLPDGRYNLVLFGLVRVRVMKEIGFGAYRTAQVELLEEAATDPSGESRRRATLRAIYVHVVKDLMKGGIPAPPDDVPLGMMCDLVASLAVPDPAARQGLLEELDPAARCDRLLRLLSAPAAPLRPRRPRPEGPSLN